jgi:hypothetical protein
MARTLASFARPDPNTGRIQLWLTPNLRNRGKISHTVSKTGIVSQAPRLNLFFQPASVEHREVDKQYFRRKDYWDRLTGNEGALSIHFLDSAKLAACPLPDSSHLDFRDKPAFTRHLLQIIQEKRYLPWDLSRKENHECYIIEGRIDNKAISPNLTRRSINAEQ